MVQKDYKPDDIVTCINWLGTKFKTNSVYCLTPDLFIKNNTTYESDSVFRVYKYLDEFRKAYKNELKSLRLK